VGAFSEPGYRRAARLGDGFIHGGGTPDEVARVFEHVRDLRARAGMAEPFDLWTEVSSPRDRAAWRETLEALAPTGATGIIVPASARLLEMLRNPDDEGDRSDLLLAQG
jgi:alkanesulfonate monooxygenase SsuD/methylene tetrahydromethanopterin reductase-like flavin-dependent oxidoreductase (luciferase family)